MLAFQFEFQAQTVREHCGIHYHYNLEITQRLGVIKGIERRLLTATLLTALAANHRASFAN